MVEAIVAIAVGYAIGCLIAVAVMSAVMFSTKGIKWMYHKSKTVMETMMEEEAKQNEKEEDEEDKLERLFLTKAWKMED